MRKRKASEATVMAFLRAVYPEDPELAAAFFDEELVLAEATRRLTSAPPAAPTDAMVEALNKAVEAAIAAHAKSQGYPVYGIGALRKAQNAAQRTFKAALAAHRTEVATT